MADNVDPEVIKFVNEHVRPLCEFLRADKVRIDNAKVLWNATIKDKIVNLPTEVIADGREAEGISRLTGADVWSAMTTLMTMADQYDNQIVEKPTVRPLKVE